MRAKDLKKNVTTIVELLRDRAWEQPEKIAYTFLLDGETESVSFTYQQLEERAKAIAAHLQTHSHPGDRVLLLYPPGLEYCAAFFACLYAGLIAVPTYPPRRTRSQSRLNNIYQNSQPTIALTDRKTINQIQQRFAAPSELTWIVSDNISNSLASQWQEPNLTAENLALLQYTSGSTGAPKGVAIAHENLLSNLEIIYAHFGHNSDSKGVIWLPPYHDMGLIGGLLQPIYGGFPVILMSPLAFLQKPIRWLQAISRYQATTSGSPNFAYDLCVQKVKPEELETLDLSSWKLAFNGAEKIRPNTLNRFSKTFAVCGFQYTAFYPCYGMAEATLFVTGGSQKAEPIIHKITDSTQSQQAVVGCGQGASDRQVIIVAPNTLTECKSGQVGEIWVAGKSVAKGYWQHPEATQKTFFARLANGGDKFFLRTGDLGFLLREELFVTGRLTERIIIRGRNYYPHDIELTVEQSHPAIRYYHTAAFSIEFAGEERLVIIAEINRSQRRSFDSEEVINAIRKAISENYELQVYAVSLLQPESLPKTSSGKLQRYLCREQFLADKLTVLGKWKLNLNERKVTPDLVKNKGEIEAIQAWLATWLSQKTCVTLTTIDPHTTFTDYGIDSIILIELMENLEQWFNVPLDISLFDKFPTIAALAQYLADYQKSKQSFAKFDTFSASPQSEIPSAYYRFEDFPEYRSLQQRRSQIEGLGLSNPFFRSQQAIAKDTIEIEGNSLINYATYNYLGLSGDPAVSQAAQAAIATYGTSVSASRLVSGEIPLHQELETEIANFIGTENSLVYVGGHATNVTTISHLLGDNDLIFYDSWSHNSLIQGALFSSANLLPFPHNDWQALEEKLLQIRHQYQRVLILIEGVYSTDGDIPNLPQFIRIKNQYKALLMVDEAHSIGVLGKSGRGISEHFGIQPAEVEIWMGTLSKSFASCGGYIAGSAALIEYLKYTAPGFVYSVGMSPANTAAALAALRKLKAEPQRVSQLQQQAKLFLSLAQAKKINTGNSHNSPIIPVIVGETIKAVQLSKNLFQRGINVPFMIHPSVPKNAARLRFFLSCLHTEKQIETTIEILTEELAKLQ
ncbi:MAG: aminotransferase class I/II-fold pyridoxal phosphate-dependent enzyme [Oscillatoria sp. PMC 1051.18]|nr:aminotransferase class I/II-fold pyridoxal phosphate-dependent enzyme [Oscillatoria sp. PMC 1050.18]MEC5031958.1 aminotransferase class I/II-fold pyridoxal phosphate-dependent enzyme [Oscillatoria sp. PMC 1051.18]